MEKNRRFNQVEYLLTKEMENKQFMIDIQDYDKQNTHKVLHIKKDEDIIN